jgi:excinuclease ABC subunit C
VFRGPKLKLVRLGSDNARQYLEATSDKKLLEEARLLAALKELQRVLELGSLPGRIEAYDISNIQGKNAVGSMIVFDFGRPKKDDYRKFKIRFKQTPDDFAMMSEMLNRRFRHVPLPSRERLGEGSPHPASHRKGEEKWPLPDLVLIDGGKGQLSAALRVIREHKQEIATIALAKRLEEIFLPGRSKPITLPNNSIALFLLQRIRDEAHRFAHRYQRLLHSKKSLSSALDDIAGIGAAKKKLLLQKFGSVGRLRQASLGEIANLVGNRLAEKIKASV